jgi:DNA-directed RNA polymerase specialized sigma24 family protein
MLDLTPLESRAIEHAMRSARRISHPAYLPDDQRQEAAIAVLLARTRCSADYGPNEQETYLARRALGGIVDGLREILRQDGRHRKGKTVGERYTPTRLVGTHDDTAFDQASGDSPLGDLLVARALLAIPQMPAPLPAVARMSLTGSNGEQIAEVLGVDPSMVSRWREALAKKLKKYL